jgi:hypothetical protein
MSPAKLMYGNRVELDKNILDNFTPQQKANMELSEWTAMMLQAQATLLKIATQHQLKKDEQHMTEKSSDNITLFPINSFVLVEYPKSNLKKGPPDKLMMNLKGPMRVVNILVNTYTLLDLTTNKESDVHITRLRPFEYDAQYTDPVDIAQRDTSLTEVKNILNHWGSTKHKANMQFHVQWADDTEESWLPWGELRSNEVLHRYLISKGLRKLIPKSFIHLYEVSKDTETVVAPRRSQKRRR